MEEEEGHENTKEEGLQFIFTFNFTCISINQKPGPE